MPPEPPFAALNCFGLGSAAKTKVVLMLIITLDGQAAMWTPNLKSPEIAPSLRNREWKVETDHRPKFEGGSLRQPSRRI